MLKVVPPLTVVVPSTVQSTLITKGSMTFTFSVAALVTPADLTTIRREWNDLKAVAGTDEAVGFGEWVYVGRFADPAQGGQMRFFENVLDRTTGAVRGVPIDLRVRPATETPANPISYQTNAGVVKLGAAGSQAAIVTQLRAALLK